ncbi:hypothetical protein DACRYDRAFT_110805 [Dacryopinax primogenitus]|uniref:Uncharacterized protein n=1 Tax=Dacryopinax primogenitus (strain DJM 731) TaxID=1858805 RepID=M5FXU8_DACPD|nr:uncharacterized protein DACRYDRAFT_110805 [Dacryopinax primogenitus]EJT98361.1 hypothetical protein DACRYDRAFT_110805 [Dacryopinax primogenitus]
MYPRLALSNGRYIAIGVAGLDIIPQLQTNHLKHLNEIWLVGYVMYDVPNALEKMSIVFDNAVFWKGHSQWVVMEFMDKGMVA